MAKILIIDDEPEHREAVKTRLEKAGHEIIEVGTGMEALLVVQHNPPDLIFLDIVMPVMNGWEVCRQLKKNPRTAKIPVIVMTAYGQDIEKLQREEEVINPDGYLAKPWEPDQLQQITQLLLFSKTGSDRETSS